MTLDSATAPAGRRSPAVLNAVLVAVAHSLVATAAVLGCLMLIRWPLDDANVATQLVQASGIVALIWAYAGLLLGLLIGIRPLRSPFNRPRTDRPGRPRTTRPGRSVILALHRQFNLVVLALVLLHASLFALAMPGGSLLVAFVPGISGPQSLGYTLGVLALYLAVVLGPSYYLRGRIGRRTWLVAHQLAALSYAVALWHALALPAGTEGLRVNG